jgi:prepilin-type N-terminal cleavage/methylation domain-containing protein
MVMTRLADERGFSLMELIWAMVLGLIILLAAFTVIDKSFLTNKQVSDREDALQRGRIALEQITRQLRSQVCIQTSPATLPISSGSDTSITFYTYLGDPTGATVANGQRDATTDQPFPEQHTISYVAANGSVPSKITESDSKVTSFNPLTVASAYKTNVLATNVYLPSGKLFQYYAGSASGGVSTTPLTTPLSASDASSVVDVAVAYKVLPTGVTATNSPQATTFQDDVFWRSVSPENTTNQPCDSN